MFSQETLVAKLSNARRDPFRDRQTYILYIQKKYGRLTDRQRNRQRNRVRKAAPQLKKNNNKPSHPDIRLHRNNIFHNMDICLHHKNTFHNKPACHHNFIKFISCWKKVFFLRYRFLLFVILCSHALLLFAKFISCWKKFFYQIQFSIVCNSLLASSTIVCKVFFLPCSVHFL